MKISNDIVKFSNGNTTAYEMFADYFRHYSDEVLKKNIGAYEKYNQEGKVVSLAEKETQMHDVMMAEIERMAGFNRPENVPDEIWATNPSFQWATFAVVTMMIETILPDTIIDSIGQYTEIRNIGYGDVPLFKVPARSLFTVSQGANAQRKALIQKQYKSDATIPVFNHVVTAGVDLYSVLAGRQNLGEFARIAVLSVETEMTRDAYGAMNTGITAGARPAALKIEGAFDVPTLVKLAQTVGAYNFGMKPVIMGTTLALAKVLPDSAYGYRLNTDASNMSIQLIRNIYGYDFIELNQIATGDYTNYSLALDDSMLYVVSPAADKIVKGVLEGATFTNITGHRQNADLSSDYTINKRWGFEFLSGAVSGSYKITG